MAKNKLPAPIQREIDKQKIIQSLSSSDDFGLCLSIHFRDDRDLEEEDRKWREDIQKLKELLEEYQKTNGRTSARSKKI